MKKGREFVLLFIGTLLLLNQSFSQISGPECINDISATKVYSVTETGTGYTYDWIIWDLGYIPPNPFSFSATTTTPSVEVKFTQPTGQTFLSCDVKNANGATLHHYELNINITPAVGPINGDFYLVATGNYNYSIPAISGATNYYWSFPSGFTGTSLTNNITVNAGMSAMEGNVTVVVAGVDLCDNSTSEYINIDPCYGHTLGEYDPLKINDKIASGDFDNDGKEDDLAGFYYYGNLNSTIHVWKSDGASFQYQNDIGWWNSGQYESNKLMGVVAGDFDNDGFKDDIAGFYNYGGATTEMHIWYSNGSSFSYASKWYSSTYDATKIGNRIVSGDFDRDGFHDDVAAFYAYDAVNTTIHVWKSTGPTIIGASTNGWFSSNSYSASKISGRIVSGDFDQDGYSDDIAALYKYDSPFAAMHVWKSNSNSTLSTSFVYQGDNGLWNSTQYDPAMTTGTFCSGDFDRDGFKDDIAAFYNYGGTSTNIHVWKSNGTSLVGPTTAGWWGSTQYDQTKIKYRVISGDFDEDSKKDDICAFYNYGDFSTTAHVWKSNGGANFIKGSTAFNYAGDNGFWGVCNPLDLYRPVSDISMNKTQTDNTSKQLSEQIVKIYPNPTQNEINVELTDEKSQISIFNLSGERVYSAFYDNSGKIKIDVSELPKGIYIVNIQSETNIYQEKIVHQ